MAVSAKQLAANRANAKKGGVKTAKGKTVARYNALKHGLLAQEVVLTQLGPAENPADFENLLTDLVHQFQPQGRLELMLVERIAVCYWRLRRAVRCEASLITAEYDSAHAKFYALDEKGARLNKTDVEIDQEIASKNKNINYWKDEKKELAALKKSGEDLSETYGVEARWDELNNKLKSLLGNTTSDPETIRSTLNKHGYLDDVIWDTFINNCDEMILTLQEELAALVNLKKDNVAQVEAMKKKANVPYNSEHDKVLRYEACIENQLYRAIRQLERLQRLRSGEYLPLPGL
jgi:hypothetical protein